MHWPAALLCCIIRVGARGLASRISMRKRRWTLRAGLAALGLLASLAAMAEPQRLRIVGGLAGVSQYTRHEEPFWTRDFPRLTNGQITAEIVPFDRAGIRGQEMLRLIQLGVVPFGTALLSLSATQDPVFGAP